MEGSMGPIDKSAKVYVAGHGGLVGSAIVRRLTEAGYVNLITADHGALDLTDQSAVREFFEENQPDVVFLCAAKVGGILANDTYPAEFIGINLMIETNVIDAAYCSGVSRFVFMGTSCIYPRDPQLPISEDALLTGPLEPTNQWYALAKIAGIKMVEAYRRQYGFSGISVMPANLYGPGDNFDYRDSHVIPALIRKFHDARESLAQTVTVWGTGKPRREFLYVDDLANATVFAMESYDSDRLLNIGTGEDISIGDLANLIGKIVGFEGRLEFDTTKPDGVERRILDTSTLRNLDWSPKIGLEEGLRRTYTWFLENIETARLGTFAS
jgi:GDP-L-fucose synthase